MPVPVTEDSPFAPPYRSDSYTEHPLIVLHDHRRLELSREVRTIHQDALVQLLDQVNVCPEPVPFVVAPDCPPSDSILTRSERIHAILQLLAHIRDSTYQTILKQFYKKHGSTNHRGVAKDLYANCHFPPAFVQYQSLLNCLSCDTCQNMSVQQLQNHTVDLLEKLAVTCIRAGWLVDAERFANRALKHEPCSTRARLWLATALMGLGNLDLARSHLALLPRSGSFPANFPKWIEQRVEVQRAMLRRLEDEQRGDYNVVAMAKERRDRVPEVVRMPGTFGIQLSPQGWRTIVKLRKGAVVIVAPPVSCAPCYVEDEDACAELHINETKAKADMNVNNISNVNKKMAANPASTIDSSDHAFGAIVLNSPLPGAGSTVPSKSPTSPQSTQSLLSPAVAPHQATAAAQSSFSASFSAPKTNAPTIQPSSPSTSLTPMLDLAFEDTFALALAADNIFTEAAEKAELVTREQQQQQKRKSQVPPQPKPKPDLTTMVLRTPPNAFLPRPVRRMKIPSVPAPAPLPTSPRFRSPLARYSFAFDHHHDSSSTPIPTAHTTEDPPLLSLSLLTDTLLNAAKTLPSVRAQVRTAAARCTRAAESVIDLVGEEVRAACVVVACFYNVAIPFSDPNNHNESSSGGGGDAKGKGKMRSFGGKNEYGTVHAGHGVYLPMFHLLSADGDKANTEATFVGPYLFLRTTKDVEAGTLLSYAGFPGTVHPPRQHTVERKRKVGLTKRPMGSNKAKGAGAGAASSEGEGGLGTEAEAEVSVISGGGGGGASVGAIGFNLNAAAAASSVSTSEQQHNHNIVVVDGRRMSMGVGVGVGVGMGAEGSLSDVGFENMMRKPSVVSHNGVGFAATPETSKGGSRGHSDF